MMSPARASSIGHALEAAEGHDLGGAAGLDDLAVGVERVDRLVELDRAALDLAERTVIDVDVTSSTAVTPPNDFPTWFNLTMATPPSYFTAPTARPETSRREISEPMKTGTMATSEAAIKVRTPRSGRRRSRCPLSAAAAWRR